MNNILIIGGSSGIGLKLAKNLSEQNYNVFATFNEAIPESGSQIHYTKFNVLEDNLNADFLPEAIHGFVYCPGSISLKPFARIKAEDFISDYSLNLVGAVKTLQVVLPKLKNAESASIILFSTVAVQSGMNFHSLVASSKGAVEGLTRSLAAELSPKIRVNCIAPSLTDTPLASSLLSTEEKRAAAAQRHPLKKYGEAEDLANLAEFLLSEKSNWITGQIIHADGGMSSLRI